MKLNIQLKRMVSKMVQLSFDKDGKLQEDRVRKNAILLGQLPKSKAVSALSFYLKQLKIVTCAYTLEINSPVDLSEADIKLLKQKFADDQNIRKVEVKIDPTLLGGLRVKTGDTVYDDSVVRKIERVKGVICLI